ncbi:hypothetical protein A374_15838 [Fictibacillus macauensis ZFHKF-1]|uniref:Membrane-associated protein n=1 Tax=Fictibacillus macauensis ZFHKF-1 TaxID=1196324 RepID=I8AF64_9BACL|nr:hypothetical protein [Fictibacillus macauensis]EIT84272.1 hypothetical protein A374_15838 [Fictibacillus macauensis ZFHKF-1]
MNTNEHASTSSRFTQKNKQPKKTALISIITIALLLIGGVTFYFIMNAKTGPEATIQAFKQAILNEDTEKVKTFLEQGQSNVTIDAQTVQSFISYAKKDRNLLATMDSLEKQAQAHGDMEVIAPVTSTNDQKWLQLKRNGTEWLFFDRYIVAIQPIAVKVASSFKNTEIYVDRQKKGNLEENDGTINAGYVLPGEHKVKAIYKGTYTTLKDEATLEMNDVKDNKASIDLPLKGEYINLTSNYSDAHLFINGKDTGKTIAQVQQIGPIATDGSITLHAEKKFDVGHLKSETVVVRNSGSISLPIDYNKPKVQAAKPNETLPRMTADEVKNFMLDYTTASVESLNVGNFGLAEAYIDPKGPAYNEARKYVDYIQKKGIQEYLDDFEVTNVDFSKPTMITVSTNEAYTITYADGSSKHKKFRSKYYLSRSDAGSLQVYKLAEPVLVN